MSAEQIIESSLNASGVSEENIPGYLHRYLKLAGALKAADGDALLKKLHSGVFTSYELKQSFTDVLIDTGRYNCVSSSIVYLFFARVLGLEAEVVEVPDHAFCRVKTPEGWKDVETTTPYGFNPGIKKEFVDDFKRTGFTYVPPGNYSARRILTDKEAVGLIIQNRMAELQRKGLHGRVVGFAVDRWVFDGGRASFRDMNNAFRNYTADLNGKNFFRKAYGFIKEVSGMYGLKEENHDLIYSMANNYLVELLDKSNFKGAWEFLDREAGAFTGNEIGSFKKMITGGELNSALEGLEDGDLEEIVFKVKKAFSEGVIPAGERDSYLTYIYTTKAAELSGKKGWWAAYNYLKSLPEDERDIAGIRKLAGQMHYNWEAGVHNSFVEYYNKRMFEEARRVLEEGLSKDPESGIIKRDLNSLNRMQGE